MDCVWLPWRLAELLGCCGALRTSAALKANTRMTGMRSNRLRVAALAHHLNVIAAARVAEVTHSNSLPAAAGLSAPVSFFPLLLVGHLLSSSIIDILFNSHLRVFWPEYILFII